MQQLINFWQQFYMSVCFIISFIDILEKCKKEPPSNNLYVKLMNMTHSKLFCSIFLLYKEKKIICEKKKGKFW